MACSLYELEKKGYDLNKSTGGDPLKRISRTVMSLLKGLCCRSVQTFLLFSMKAPLGYVCAIYVCVYMKITRYDVDMSCLARSTSGLLF